MEEQVGQLWHRLVTRAASRRHPEAAVRLAGVQKTVAVLFRALGGDGALSVAGAQALEHGARRGWLERIAGSGREAALAWRDETTLRLPECIDLFADPALNRDLYLWLAALAAQAGTEDDSDADWLVASARQTCAALARFPGLAPRYEQLVAAHLAQRPDPGRLPADEAAAERSIRAVLADPAAAAPLPGARRPPAPVPLWLHPAPPRPQSKLTRPLVDPPAEAASGHTGPDDAARKRQAERVDDPDGKRGLLAFRLESMFSWTEYVKVDRCDDDSEDDQARSNADDLRVLSVARGKAPATKLRFDLDLPSAGQDDIPLGDGIPVPEWDWKRGVLLPDHCRVQLMLPRGAVPAELPAHLRVTARRLRAQFEQLRPVRSWLRGLPDGADIDLDAWLAHRAERMNGTASGDVRLYRDFRGGVRDLACLLLADLSLSTDAWVGEHGRVIDVIRDALHLFAEALAATGDRYALYGFSSRRRDHVRLLALKAFDERHDAGIRGRIAAIRPGYYTRMGAAIRHATTLLGREPASRRILILLTDGKPNDLDRYEGRWGIEDTRAAIREAREAGLQPFCVTIDEQAHDYLPYLFGTQGWVLIRKPAELPRELPLLYARLTG